MRLLVKYILYKIEKNIKIVYYAVSSLIKAKEVSKKEGLKIETINNKGDE